jgi:60S ribosome subunit biogenesis protein NIP7
MRPLTDEETEKFFKKLSNYIGDNIKLLLEREDGEYVFRLHKDRVYYCRFFKIKIFFNFLDV